MKSTMILCWTACLPLLVQAAFANEPFFDGGRTEWKIYLSPQADPTETFAAEELSNALRKISGARFEVIASGEVPQRRVIIIGDLNNPEVQSRAAALRLAPSKIEQIAVYTLDGRLYLAGNQPRGALYAAYRFLQHELGVRWLWPGPEGEFMPAKKTWSLPELKFNYQPPFTYRGFHLCGDSSVGVREDRWNPPWRAKTGSTSDAWEAEMVVPLTSLGPQPNPTESWQARFLRHHGGPDSTASTELLLVFTSAARTDRSLLWWSGAPDREAQRNAALVEEFTGAGWQFDLVSDPEKLPSLGGRRDAYWFRHPHGPNKVPANYWEKHLVPAVKNGALAVFVSYWNVPLEQYFQDPSLRVKTVQCGKVPLAGRTTASIAPGDWSSQPHNLLRGLREQITPAYGFEPADADAWTVLATAANGSDRPYPYLLARRYGKGMIILGGDDIRLAPVKMLENFVRFRDAAPPAAP